MRGELHAVHPMADNDGLNNTYYQETPAGDEAVTETPELLVRIREVYALDYVGG